MLGADAVAISNSALQAIGCLGMRACNTNNCPVGIATQKENLRNRIIIDSSAWQLFNFLDATTTLMKVVARACGYDDFRKFNKEDLVTSSQKMHQLTAINFAGINYN
jgi:glutamate synthase domain-containing protein 2